MTRGQPPDGWNYVVPGTPLAEMFDAGRAHEKAKASRRWRPLRWVRAKRRLARAHFAHYGPGSAYDGSWWLLGARPPKPLPDGVLATRLIRSGCAWVLRDDNLWFYVGRAFTRWGARQQLRTFVAFLRGDAA